MALTVKVLKHQIRVIHSGHTVYTSGVSQYKTAESRCRSESIKAGVGAIGTVYEVTDKTTDPPEMRPVFEARVVYGGARGTPTLVIEDHNSPMGHD